MINTADNKLTIKQAYKGKHTICFRIPNTNEVFMNTKIHKVYKNRFTYKVGVAEFACFYDNLEILECFNMNEDVLKIEKMISDLDLPSEVIECLIELKNIKMSGVKK